MLIHGASGGVGTASLQLGRLAGVETYGTCSAQAADVVKELGATPIDYRNSDFVPQIHRFNDDGVDLLSTASVGTAAPHARCALPGPLAEAACGCGAELTFVATGGTGSLGVVRMQNATRVRFQSGFVPYLV